MYEYQDDGVAFLRSHPRALLGDEPGLGKTRQLLLAATGATLAIVPAMLIGVWEQERSKWRSDLDLTIVPYTSLCERTAHPTTGRRTVVQPRCKDEYRRTWDTLICDEAHYLKGRNTSWTRAVKAMRADRLWLASGTPIPNYADDLFMLAQLLHPGDARFTSYWRWAEHWFPIWNGRFGRKVGARLRKERTWPEFHTQNLGERYLARTWDDLDEQLPPLRHQTIDVQMTSAQRRAYAELKDDFCTTLDDGTEVVTWNSGSQATQMVKITTALELVGGKGSGKIDALGELLDDWIGHPCVLVCQFKATATLLMDVCRKHGRDPRLATGDVPPAQRFALAQAFQAGDGDTLVATIESVAEGITLTRADRMVFVEKSYRPSRNEQVEKRVWRISQERPVLVVDLVSVGTVDAKIRRILARKTDTQMRALTRAEFASLL